jgi:hypothetical protein
LPRCLAADTSRHAQAVEHREVVDLCHRCLIVLVALIAEFAPARHDCAGDRMRARIVETGGEAQRFGFGQGSQCQHVS